MTARDQGFLLDRFDHPVAEKDRREALRDLVDTLYAELDALPPPVDGEDGADGASAYEVAVADGFVGTETEWLESLVGAPGQDGAPGSGGGAPDTVDYLVGTADATLTSEIVVGTSPGGELGGTWASPTVDASHSGSTHAAVQAAAEATAAGALAGHVAAADPHTAYQRESEKDTVNGYAGLNGSGLVPDARIDAAITRDTELDARLSAANATDLTDGGETTLHTHDDRYQTLGLTGTTVRVVPTEQAMVVPSRFRIDGTAVLRLEGTAIWRID